MRHFDTGVLASPSLILPETASEPISGCFQSLPADGLAVSLWPRGEFALPPPREIRMGNPDAAPARKADLRFETMLKESFAVLLPSRDDFDQAKDWLGRFETSPRAGDALHLATAGNRRTDAIYSLDKLTVAAGKRWACPQAPGSPFWAMVIDGGRGRVSGRIRSTAPLGRRRNG